MLSLTMNKFFYIVLICLNGYAVTFDLDDVTEQAINQGKKVNQVVREREAEEERRYQEWKRNHPEAFQNNNSVTSSSQSSSNSYNSTETRQSSSPTKGLKRLEDNGKSFNNNQSWRAICNDNSSRILFRSANGQHWLLNGSTSDMGPRYDSWSVDQVADYACKEL